MRNSSQIYPGEFNMSKLYRDYFARADLSKYERLVLKDKILSVNRFTFLLQNIIEENNHAIENNKPQEFQKAINQRWTLIAKKHRRAWERYTKEYKKLFKNKK